MIMFNHDAGGDDNVVKVDGLTLYGLLACMFTICTNIVTKAPTRDPVTA